MNDLRLRFWGQLTICVVSFFFFYITSVTEANISLLKLILYIVITTFIVWEAVRLSILLSRAVFPGIAHIRKRFVLTGLLTLLTVSIIPPVKFWLADLIHLYGEDHQPGSRIALHDYLRIMGQNIFYCLFIATIYEATYFFSLWKETFIHNETLAKQRLVAQLDSLKMQMSPHFLFNTLNTLSSLIRRDNTRAEKFVEEMSEVYRYLLTVNEKNLVTLKEELDFLDDYAALLQTRFNNHFRIERNVAPLFFNAQLPPLTLQLLIENAVKHNVATADSPLVLKIYTLENSLIVENRIQRKQVVQSGGKGLENIQARFRLTGLPPVTITETDVYRVSIPLHQTPVDAGTDH